MASGYAQRQSQKKTNRPRTPAAVAHSTDDEALQSARHNRGTLPQQSLIALQQTHGNRFVSRLVDEARANQAPQAVQNHSESDRIQRVDGDTLVSTGIGVGGGALIGGLITWLTGMPPTISTPLFGILGGVIANLLTDSESDTEEQDSRRQRLAENSFRTSAGLKIYGEALSKGFNDFLSTLKQDDSWLDGGAGQAQAMSDYAEAGGKASMTAVNYKLPENQSLINAMLEASEIDFTSLEGDFEALFNKKEMPAASYKLITDNNGVLMYSEHFDQDLLRYLQLLKHGGRLYAASSEVRIYPSKEDYERPREKSFDQLEERALIAAFEKWVSEIEGVDVISINPFVLERNEDEISVPELEVLAYDGSTSPPKRAYKRA